MIRSVARTVLHALPLYNGKGRIIDRTFLSRLRFDQALLDVRTRDGITIRVDPNDLIGRTVYLTGRFDRCVVDVLADLAEPGDTLWDIGANIGCVSCAFLARVKGARVLAVEPMPEVSKLLQHNLAQFGDRAATVQAAVSETAGSASMARTPGNLGRSHISTEGGVQVRVVSGDELAAQAQPNVIKIDVEGHEVAVLKGIAAALEQHRPRGVVFEHHVGDRSVDPTILSLFDRLEYRVFRLGRKWSGWRLLELNGPRAGYEPSADYVALPREATWQSLGRSNFS